METSNKQTVVWLMSILIKAAICLAFCLLATRAVRGQTWKHTAYPFIAQPLRDKVKQIYTSQIGVREKHPNSGPEVEKYLRYVNLPKGNPWCAAFVCWVYGEAGITNPRSAWSPALLGDRYVIWGKDQRTKSKEQRLPQSAPYAYSHSLATGKWQRAIDPRQLRIPDSTPKTGDVFGLYFPEKRRIAHVGFIDEWNDPGVVTVEGNTNVLGSREGDGVYRKRRLVKSVYKVARYVN